MEKSLYYDSLGTIDDNDVFYYQKSENSGITSDELQKFINYHRSELLPKYLKFRDYFKGKHKILNRLSKPIWKPDNRLVYNFPKKIVNTFGGYFLGVPAKIDIDEDSVKDEQLTDWLTEINFEDVNYEVSKQVDIYGRSHYFLYQDEDARTCITAADPRNTFVIYSDDVKSEPLYAVRYRQKQRGIVEGSLYDKEKVIPFVMKPGGGLQFSDENNSEKNKFFGEIPIIETYSNEERMCLFEDVLTLVDAVDSAMSDKQNDSEAQADSILKIIGASLGDSSKDPKKIGSIGTKLKEIRDNRTLLVPAVSQGSTIDVGYIEKTGNDGIVEHLVDRNINLIYQISMVANINDEEFGNASGTSLEFKLQPMSNMADMKARKMSSAIKKVVKIGLETKSITDSDIKIDDDLTKKINITFSKVIPHNLKDEADTFAQLVKTGKVSDKTALKVLSVVDDPDKEIEEVAKKQDSDLEDAKRMADKFAPDENKGNLDDNDSRTAE